MSNFEERIEALRRGDKLSARLLGIDASLAIIGWLTAANLAFTAAIFVWLIT